MPETKAHGKYNDGLMLGYLRVMTARKSHYIKPRPQLNS